MEPLPLEAFKVSIVGEAPEVVAAGSEFQVPLKLQNLGTGIFFLETTISGSSYVFVVPYPGQH